MEYVLTIIMCIVTSSISILVGIFWKSEIAQRNKKEQNEKATQKGLMCALKFNISNMYEKYVEDRGWMSVAMKNILEQIYSTYKELGGNGVADEMYNKMMELTTQPPNLQKQK